jgi:hypothetical protein
LFPSLLCEITNGYAPLQIEIIVELRAYDFFGRAKPPELHFVRIRFPQSDEFCRGSLESHYAKAAMVLIPGLQAGKPIFSKAKTPKGQVNNFAKFALHSLMVALCFGAIRWMFVGEQVSNSYQLKATGRDKGRDNVIQGRKNGKKRGRQPFDRPFELGFGLCFQQNVQGGWGSG